MPEDSDQHGHHRVRRRRRVRIARRLLVLTSVVMAQALSAVMPAHAAFPGENGLIAFTRNGRIWVTDTQGNDTSSRPYVTWSAAAVASSVGLTSQT